MKNQKVSLEVGNLDELIDLLKEAKKHAEELQSTLNKINQIKLDVNQKSV